VDDLAILRGIGVFDLIRIKNGKPLFLQEHINRLHHSAREIHLDIPWSQTEITRTALETLARNDLAEANLRIIITGGPSRDFMTPGGHPRLLMLVTPFSPLPRWWYDQGIKVITLSVERRLPGAKSIDYLTAALAMGQARDKGAVEAVYLGRKQEAMEGTTSNLFAFIDHTLVTPGQGVLSGITRQVVLDLATHEYPVQVRDLYYEELIGAREVFITGTNKDVVPVIQVDDTVIGDGRPGDDTRRLMAMLDAHVASLA
jgi:branched-chain amino acid aminotransferase